MTLNSVHTRLVMSEKGKNHVFFTYTDLYYISPPPLSLSLYVAYSILPLMKFPFILSRATALTLQEFCLRCAREAPWISDAHSRNLLEASLTTNGVKDYVYIYIYILFILPVHWLTNWHETFLRQATSFLLFLPRRWRRWATPPLTLIDGFIIYYDLKTLQLQLKVLWHALIL